MTTPDHPLPSEGGSYIRNPDGSLTPLADPVDEVAGTESLTVPEATDEKTPAQPRRRSTPKED